MAAVRHDVFAPRRRPSRPADRCEHCGQDVDRVWLVPGDVLNSCRACFQRLCGRQPVHAQGHSSAPGSAAPYSRPASFHQRADGRRPA